MAFTTNSDGMKLTGAATGAAGQAIEDNFSLLGQRSNPAGSAGDVLTKGGPSAHPANVDPTTGAATFVGNVTVADAANNNRGDLYVGSTGHLYSQDGGHLHIGGYRGVEMDTPDDGTSPALTVSGTGIFTGAITLGGPVGLKSYTVGTLPTPGTAARTAYASNGRNPGEGAAAGTGCVVWDNGTNWIAASTGATVAA